MDRYHSTVECLSSPSLFVTYHDAQALPEYLVTFSKETDPQRPGALGASGMLSAPALVLAPKARPLAAAAFSSIMIKSYNRPAKVAKRSRRPRRKAPADTEQDIVPHATLPGQRFCKLCSCPLPSSDSVIAKHLAGKRHQSLRA